MRSLSETIRRWAGTVAWILLVLASMILIVYGIARRLAHLAAKSGGAGRGLDR
jgi:hypothetical protein